MRYSDRLRAQAAREGHYDQSIRVGTLAARSFRGDMAYRETGLS